MIKKKEPFPFGNEGPPDKLTKAQKRDFKPDHVRGYVPTISMNALVYLRQKKMTPLTIIVFQLLIREAKMEDSQRKPVDRLRVPPSVRRYLSIDTKVYRQCLTALERAGAVSLDRGENKHEGWTARILIDTDCQTREVWEDMYGTKHPTRY